MHSNCVPSRLESLVPAVCSAPNCGLCQSTPTSGTLIYEALSLTSPGSQTYLGASKNSDLGLTTGWSWVDGTPASNLNCGYTGCTLGLQPASTCQGRGTGVGLCLGWPLAIPYHWLALYDCTQDGF